MIIYFSRTLYGLVFHPSIQNIRNIIKQVNMMKFNVGSVFVLWDHKPYSVFHYSNKLFFLSFSYNFFSDLLFQFFKYLFFPSFILFFNKDFFRIVNEFEFELSHLDLCCFMWLKSQPDWCGVGLPMLGPFLTSTSSSNSICSSLSFSF